MSLWKKVTLVFVAAWLSLICSVAQLCYGAPVSFDVASLLAVRELPGSTAARPGTKLIAIEARASLFVNPQWRSRCDDVVITLESPAAEFEVVDFAPRTQLDSRFAGPIQVTLNQQQHASLEFDALGQYKALTGATLQGSYLDATQAQGSFELLPPRELLLASGSVQRGRGVYFKLRGSDRSTLEGEQRFMVIARVPSAWRADLLLVTCEAHGSVNPLLDAFGETGLVTRDHFLVAMYLEQDVSARTVASTFVQRQQELERIAQAERRAIERNTTPKTLRKIGLSASSLPPDWLDRWLLGPTDAAVVAKFPAPVRDAAWAYAQARTELHRLSRPAPRLASRPAL